MLHQIRINASGRVIDAPGGDSVLQCGLRAGLNLPYHCERGSCGKCRARLLNGRVEPLFHSDFVFPQSEREQGWFLACAHSAATDLELELAAIGSLDSLPLQSIQARVRRIERPSTDRQLLQLRSARSSVLRFVAGQAVELVVAGVGRRRLFLANCPCDAIHPQLHVRRFDQDPLSDYLFGALKIGDSLHLSGPYGRFVLPPAPLPRLLFVCWETGFAPVQSLLEQAMALGLSESVHIYWLARQQSGRYLRNYCRALADSEDLIHYHGIDLAGPESIAQALQAELGGQTWDDAAAYVVVPRAQAKAVAVSLWATGLAPARCRIAGPEFI